MKKNIKNAIMIGMAAVLIGTSAVTFSYAGMNARTQAMPQAGFSQKMPGDMHGGMKGGNGMQQMPNGGNSQNNQQTPPEMPNNSGDSNSQNNQQTPPEMPNNSSNSNSQNNQQTPDSNADNSTQTQGQSNTDGTPTADATALTSDTQLTANKQLDMHKTGVNGTVIASLCYAFFALQIGIILLIVAYLIMSKGNKISFNEVFKK